ncbi:MAG TPA: hypothetical protein VK474_13740 [Chthoniobacterales bacterium]|nr:hypothetical protein [Chthoniobacterales bacterium]
MKILHSFCLFVVSAGLCVAGFSVISPARAATVNVTQHHNHDSRDGLFVAPGFTLGSAANLTRDTGFDGTIVGGVFAQPLYVEGGPNGPVVIAVTEENNVYALNATTGAIIWQRNMGASVNVAGNINPLGITGTPVVDLASRSLFFDSITTGPKRYIYSLNVDTGATNPGWPVDVSVAIPGFSASIHTQRAALGIVGNIVYVPYGGYFGDAGAYHGRLVGVQMSNPAAVLGWATTASKGGVWGPGGVASDGVTPFITTGNTTGTGGTWGGGEAVIRLQPGPVFSGSTADYWAPTNWLSLDTSDADLGGSGPILVDVPGATPSALVVALGKDGNAYLLNRSNLGGISAPVASSHVGSGSIIQAAASYRTALGTYVVFRANSTTVTAFRINATNPPTISNAWSVSKSGAGSPFVTSSDGSTNMIVWVVGLTGDRVLTGYNADTGAVVYSGTDVIGDANGNYNKFNTGIAARGRIYFAARNKVYAFRVPGVTAVSAVSRKTHGKAGTFDVSLPLTGTPGIECRSGGTTNDYEVVVTFNGAVSVNGAVQAEVTAGDVGAGGVTNGGVVSASGNTVSVPLTNLTNAQTHQITLHGVADGTGYGDVVVPISVLVGDVVPNGSVSSSDVSATKAQSSQAITSANFRADVLASGGVNSSDIGVVKAATGTVLAP